MLDRVLDAIGPLDADAMAEAAARLDRLTKPPGSLGRLETLVDRARRDHRPSRCDRRRTAWSSSPPRTTASCARACRPTPPTSPPRWSPTSSPAGPRSTSWATGPALRVVVVDAGVASPIPVVEADPARGGRLVQARIRDGTADMTDGPAMTRDEALRAVATGIDLAGSLWARRPRSHRRRRDGDRQHDGRQRHLRGPDRTGRSRSSPAGGPASTMRRIGARSPPSNAPSRSTARIGATRSASWRPSVGSRSRSSSGSSSARSEARIPVVLDGFITGAAALVAATLQPAVAPRLIAAHRSIEPGHAVILEHLERRPLLDLDLRLGEGTGAALAMGLIGAAVRLRDGMATFESAAVSGPTAGGSRHPSRRPARPSRAEVAGIILVRHASTAWTGRRYCGRSDPPLSAAGRWPRRRSWPRARPDPDARHAHRHQPVAPLARDRDRHRRRGRDRGHHGRRPLARGRFRDRRGPHLRRARRASRPTSPAGWRPGRPRSTGPTANAPPSWPAGRGGLARARRGGGRRGRGLARWSAPDRDRSCDGRAAAVELPPPATVARGR